MRHFRICVQGGIYVGGEFSEYSHAATWARQYVGGFWEIVETDRFGNIRRL